MANPSGLRLLLTAILGLSIIHSNLALDYGFPYGHQKVRGVNLGGWLILSPWVTPSLFENTGDNRIIDEWTFAENQDKAKAYQILSKHWDTFITEKDFKDIAAAGLNHVRLPIGYWAFDVAPGEPYIQGQLPYLNKAVDWARKHNLKLIVDLHGAPGSQNGFVNSGQKKDVPEWHAKQSNVDRTSAIIKRLAVQFRDMTGVVPIINSLNEPAGFFSQDLLNVTKQYWYDSYGNIRYPYSSSRKSNTVLMIHDSFQPLSYWKGFMPYPKFEGVIIDTHIHQIFSQEANALSEDEHIKNICNLSSDLVNSPLWTVVAEWSPAATDCAKNLNGRGVGARYDGTYPGSSAIGSCQGKSGSGLNFSAEYKRFLRQFWEAQTITFEKAQGWIQYTWKAENADDWSYQAGLENGWIPRDPLDRQYPGICG